MAATTSGTIVLNTQLSTAFTAPAGGNILSPYAIPISISPAETYIGGAITANAIQKIAQIGGNSSSVTTLDLSLTAAGAGAVQCTDQTYGFTHVREWIILNDSATDGQFIKLDLTVTNSFGPHATPGSGFIEGTMTTVKVDIHPGGNWFRWAKPIGSIGVLVDSTHKIITLDPVGVAIPWRMIICGD